MGFDTNRCKGTCNICLLIEELKDKNVLTITAAGNEGPYLGSVKCPGNSSAALTVGAINLNSKIADFSSRGRYGQNKPYNEPRKQDRQNGQNKLECSYG